MSNTIPYDPARLYVESSGFGGWVASLDEYEVEDECPLRAVARVIRLVIGNKESNHAS